MGNVPVGCWIVRVINIILVLRKASDSFIEDSANVPIRGAEEFASAYMWASIMLRCLLISLGWSALNSSLLYSGLVFSTHFSGVGTVECLSSFAVESIP